MYNFTGCECAICHQRFKIDSDIVVCPDCGTPYHRACYASLGHCKHQDAHRENFEWQPAEDAQRANDTAAAGTNTITCPRCNADNDAEKEYCKQCGLSLTDVKKASHSSASRQGAYQTQHGNTPSKEQLFEQIRNGLPPSSKLLDQNETFADVPVAEWVAYIGKASPSYLSTFLLMKTQNRKYSFSFSAMLFGPLYFFYRKAWSWAWIFTLITIALNAPAFITLLVYSESVYITGINETALSVVSQITGVLSWVAMMIRGLYGNYLYQSASAHKIKKIKTRAKSPKEKATLLQMYGGTSIGAVVLVLGLAIMATNGFSLLLGPEFDAVLEMLYS